MASLIRGELARVLIEEVSDPSLKEIVITDVDLSPDLKHAKVFFSRGGDLSETQEQAIARGFDRASPFFRRKIGEHLKLRYVPDLEFRRDLHGESLNRLMHLFDDVAIGSDKKE
jgi:ribosome-binding factor A